jgi:hypothetical protein
MGVASIKGKERNLALREFKARVEAMPADGRETAFSLVRLASQERMTEADWRIQAISPKTGPMKGLLQTFKRETDAPLEIAFFSALHCVSALLLSKGVTLEGAVGRISPELWTIVLAPSGSCKTLTFKAVSKQAPVAFDFGECASSAKFFESLKAEHEKRGFALWFQDEVAQILKQIETPNSPLSEVKSYLLRAYGNDRIVRNTKTGGDLAIDRPCIDIFALNTVESFLNAISAESMLDGFAQRFAMVLAQEDKSRDITDFPLYDMHAIERGVEDFWQDINAVPLHSVYTLSDEATKCYKDMFRMLYSETLNKSFYRRINFLAFKYALAFHVLLRKADSTIDEEDMAYAMDLVKLHLQDMCEFLAKKSGIREVIDIARKARMAIKIKKGQGKRATARDLTQGMRNDIANASDANFMLEMMGESDLAS